MTEATDQTTPPAADPAPVDPVVTDTTPPVKRGRGRPPKAESATPIPPGSSVPPKSKPGRKPSVKREPLDIAALSQQIAGIHMLAAQITGIPEVQINEYEAQMLATSVVAVCNEYDLSLDGKTGAFLQLIASAAIVYLPRVSVIRARLAEKDAPKHDIAPSP